MRKSARQVCKIVVVFGPFSCSRVLVAPEVTRGGGGGGEANSSASGGERTKQRRQQPSLKNGSTLKQGTAVPNVN